MSSCPSLTLQTIALPAGAEWSPGQSGLGFCRASGSGYLLGKKLACELMAGSVIQLASHSDVRFRASQLQPLQLHYFYLRPELLSGLLTMAEQGVLANLATQLEVVPRVFDANHPLSKAFAKVCSQPKPLNELVERAELLHLTGVALGAELHSITKEPDAHDSRKRFLTLLRKMSEAELHGHTLSELAVMCGCSERHFSRLFQNHFGINLRTKQIAFRLSRAKQLLCESNSKVIHIALESGFKHVGQFNMMFKRQFGTTPTKWRQREAKPKSRSHRSSAVLGFMMAMLLGTLVQSAEPPKIPAVTNTPAAATAPTSTNAPAKPTFKVDTYEVNGNTLLTPAEISGVLTNFIGPAVSVEQIVLAQKTLNLAYRRKGYVTVGTALPPQRITNGVVQLQVTEGRLTEINVIGNNHFSSNNIMRALPSLRTNQFIQLQWFNPELDRANQNSDRQIYPEIVPGPEPGTSALMLKVKDHFPLHGRFEVNNQATPGTPDYRMNGSLQYNNLWQLEHSIGLQYGFSPTQMKEQNALPARFYDQPLIANYSGYYRMPLSAQASLRTQAEANPEAFGYDAATKQFRLPPASGNPELSFFASRSTTDTGIKTGPTSLITPPTATNIIVRTYDTGQDLSQSESLGWRVNLPLPEVGGVKSSLSAGMDYKSYYSPSYNTNNFPYQITVYDSFGNPTYKTTLISAPQPARFRNVVYFPLTLRWEGTRADAWGQNSFFAGCAANIPFYSGVDDFQNVAGSASAKAHYLTTTFGWSREQKLYNGYTLLMRADGQWANAPLISNEQFGIAGTGAVRGYQDGESFGDTGWKVSFEPRSPFFDLGMVDGTMPMRVRCSVFTDYGQVYYLDPARGSAKKLWGTGLGVQSVIAQMWDARIALGWVLNETPNSPAGSFRATFAVGVQF